MRAGALVEDAGLRLEDQRHMIPTITGGIAHGTSASARASQRSRSGCVSSSASPSARHELDARDGDGPDQADLEDWMNRSSCQQPRKLSMPMKCVGTPSPARESVKPR